MADRLSVLALDLATVTGWSAWHPGLNEPRPHFDAVRLKGKVGEVGKASESLRVLLGKLFYTYRPTHVCFEAQHVPVPKFNRATGQITTTMSIDTVYKLIALGAMVEWYCYRTGVPSFKVEISTWRKHFLGRGGGFKKAGLDPKQEAIKKCEAIGVYTENDNAAEAVGILDYFLTLCPDVVPPWRHQSIFERT